MSALDIPDNRALEDLCINTIYASLLTGKLSPHTKTFQIRSCTARDLHPARIDYPGMITTLSTWSSQCDLVLAEIAGRIRDVKASATERRRVEDEFDKLLEEAKEVGKKKKGKKGITMEPENEMMDV